MQPYNQKQNLNLVIPSLKAMATELDCLAVASVVLDDERFSYWSGSHMELAHHYGEGGLCQHTGEVISSCLLQNKFFSYEVDEVELFLAALFHDTGKMFDYAPEVAGKYDKWVPVKHKRMIHHVSKSALIWSEAIKKTENAEFIEKYHETVLHAILAHHGQREWGSPVAPLTKVAWLVHLCDSLSARMYDAEHGRDILSFKK